MTVAADSFNPQRLLLQFVHELHEFRIPELLSVADMFHTRLQFEDAYTGQLINPTTGTCGQDGGLHTYSDHFPFAQNECFLIVHFESRDIAAKILSRCVQIREAYELWTCGKDRHEAVALAAELIESDSYIKQRYVHSENGEDQRQWKLVIEGHGRRYNAKEKMAILLETQPQLGSVMPKTHASPMKPDVEFVIVEDYGVTKIFEKTGPRDVERGGQTPRLDMKDVRRCWFGVRFCETGRHLISDYDLKRRSYIGITSMNATLSFLVANQAQICKNMVVYDPFCGTASLLVSAAHHGAFVLGSDLDYKVLKGKPDGRDIFSNFDQYGLHGTQRIEAVRVDLSCHPWRFDNTLDAIICDPPYMRRAGSRQIGRHREIQVTEELVQSGQYYPSSIVYDVDNLIKDLLSFAAKALVMGGRLVYFLPTGEDFAVETHVPTHPCLRFIAHSCDYYSTKNHRRLITVEKIKQPPNSKFYNWDDKKG